MKKIFIGFIAFWVLVAGAWGQTPNWSIAETDKGCKVLYTGALAQPPITWTGTCEGGYASGIGLFSYDLPGAEVRRIYIKGARVAGKASGATWQINDAYKLSSVLTGSMWLFAYSDGISIGSRLRFINAGYGSSEKLASLEVEEILETVKNLQLASLNPDEFFGDVKRYLQNPTSFMLSQRIAPSVNITTLLRDDPKIRGRIFRGD